MTKKHYAAIAKIIKGHTKETHIGFVICRNAIAIELSHVLQQENPKFNQSKFLKACGLDV